MTIETLLSPKQKAIAPIAAFTAIGDLPRLNKALARGLDAGLSINECKEVLVQLYAYAGFPRSLNALTELMKLLQTRKDGDIADVPGQEPSPLPQGANMLEIGTANQTRLSGAPVKGALFEFAPAIDLYLKTHLFGDIFARDNIDWQCREIATVAALATMSGVESQLQAHMRISMNVDLSAAQLRQIIQLLTDEVGPDAGRRAQAALDTQLSNRPQA